MAMNSRTRVMTFYPRGRRRSWMSRERSIRSGSSAPQNSYLNRKSHCASKERYDSSKRTGLINLSVSPRTLAGRRSRTPWGPRVIRELSLEECTRDWNRTRVPGLSRSSTHMVIQLVPIKKWTERAPSLWQPFSDLNCCPYSHNFSMGPEIKSTLLFTQNLELIPRTTTSKRFFYHWFYLYFLVIKRVILL